MKLDTEGSGISTGKIMIIITVIIAIGIGGLYFILPSVGAFFTTNFSNGMGFKGGAITSFAVTFVLFVVFAIASGDGILGELQFMLAGFLLFFIIFWLLITWIF